MSFPFDGADFLFALIRRREISDLKSFASRKEDWTQATEWEDSVIP